MLEDDKKIDRIAMRTAFEKAAPGYDDAAILQKEVAERLVDRMDLMRIQPAMILDAGSGTGFLGEMLSQKYKQAKIVSLDIAHNMLTQAKSKIGFKQRWNKTFRHINAEVENLPFADQSFDLIVSGLTLQWCQDLDSVFKEFRRALKPGGLLMFSTFGPDSLKELRASWQAVDDGPHVNEFIDMHDVGDALLQSQYLDPVMDMEIIQVTYNDVKTIMRDLKQIGAHNVMQGRSHQITGKNKLSNMMKAYEEFRHNGVLPVTYEIVYGHAWLSEEGSDSNLAKGSQVVDFNSFK